MQTILKRLTLSILESIGRFCGAMFLVIAIGASASAQGFGRFSTGCLANDPMLKNQEGLAPLDAAAVVTVSPGQLWPPNKGFSNLQIGMSLPGAVQLNSAITANLTINGITDDQISEDNSGGPGCNPQGSDWQPSAGGLFASGNLQTASDTISIAGVQMRRERCSDSGTRTYQIYFTCCDITNGVCDSTPQVLNVLAPRVHAPVPGGHHYEYVLPDANLYVYDMNGQFSLVKHMSLPTGAGVRGLVASAATGRLYISYGSDNTTGGSLLAYDLRQDAVLWARKYRFGIDSMSISPDGTKIYMPTGELTAGGIWKIIDAITGNVIGAIDSGGRGPHNTVVGRGGTYIFMGPRASNYLVMADAATNAIFRQIGPVLNGVRPFTINGRSSLAFITTTGFLGFYVADTNSGQVLYTVPVTGFPTTGGAASAPSHGISLSPDEKEIYLIDSINSYVHVFDVSGLPGTPPNQVADIALTGQLSGDEFGCAYDCLKDGWLHHSRNGRFVFVGDSGDVIDTKLRKTIAILPAMANTRKEIEIDREYGVALWGMRNRSSIGRRN